MAEKFSIYAGAPMATALAGYEDQRSARINQVCRDYLLMLPALVPELSQPEWCATLDALNGALLDDEAALRFTWAEVADCQGLGDKWGVDQQALSTRLRALSLPELAALAEVARRFWADPSRPTDEGLRQAGARIAG